MSDSNTSSDSGATAFHNGLDAKARGSFNEAYDHLVEALDHFDAADRANAASVTLNQLGAIAHQCGNTEDAAFRYRDALARAEVAQDNATMALSCGNLGALHLDMGDFVRARIFALRSLELYATVPDPVGRGNQLGNLGIIAHQTGQTDQARTYLTDAIGAFLIADHPVGAGRTLLRFGEMDTESGDLAHAAENFHRAGDLLARAGDRDGLAYVLRSLGHLCRRTGDLEGAQRYFLRGRDLHVAMADCRGESAALIDLANIIEAQGDPIEALSLRRQALELSRTSGSRQAMASALLALGAGLFDQGRTTLAHDAVDDAIDIYRALEMPKGLVRALVTRSNIRRTMGDLRNSGLDLDQAHKLLEGLGSLPSEAAAIAGARAGLEELRGDTKAARIHLKRAHNQYLAANMPAGAHHAALIELQLNALSSPDRDIVQALQDERLMAANGFYETTGDTNGQWLVLQTRARLKRCHRDLQGAADLFDQLAAKASSRGHVLDAVMGKIEAAHTRMRTGSTDQGPTLTAMLGEVTGAPLLRILLHCVLSEHFSMAGEFDQSAAHLHLAQNEIEEIPGDYHRGVATALDAACRLAMARGEIDRAADLGDQATFSYEAADNLLGAGELRVLLS